MTADADTSLVAILSMMGLLSGEDQQYLDYVVDPVTEERDTTRDLRIAAYLVNNEKLTEQQVNLAVQFQQKLRSPNLMDQTKAMAAVTKMRSQVLRHQIHENTRLAEALLKSTDRIQKKSTTGENLAVGFLMAKTGHR